MRRGFSLVELVVVMALLGITAALAAPALMSALDRDESHASVRAARTLLEDSRSLALQRGIRVDVVVDSVDGKYWVMAAGDSVMTGEISLTNGARLELKRARAHFAWDARAASSADTLHIIADRSRTMLTIDPWSGEVIVDER
jgi:prepilin-type N-terminal cleavage/methylation domain-containing protein